MYRKKIIKILLTFDDHDWRACHKYLKYCSQKDSKSLKIFEYFLKNKEKLNQGRIDQNTVKKKLFTGLEDKTFLNRLSDLSLDVERFLVHQEMLSKSNAHDYNRALAIIYKKRGLYAYFRRIIDKLIGELESGTTIDLFDHWRSIEAHHILYFSDSYGQQDKPISSLLKADDHLKRLSSNLNLYYETELMNMQDLYKLTTSPIEVPTAQDPVYDLIYHYQKLTTERSETSYDVLKEQLFSSEENIAVELRQAILLSLINYCFFRSKEGDHSKMREVPEMFIYGLDSSLLLHHGHLSETRFLNIVDVISNYNKEIIGEEFLSQWIHKVSSEDLKSVERIAMAIWHFANDNYERTLEILNQSEIHLTRPNLSHRSRWMQICALCTLYDDHFEKEEVLNAARMFFKRHREELNDQTYYASMNLIEIVKLFWNNSPVRVIRSEIEKADYLVLRVWVNKMLMKRTQEVDGSLGK